jgi:hypothetical protein
MPTSLRRAGLAICVGAVLSVPAAGAAATISVTHAAAESDFSVVFIRNTVFEPCAIICFGSREIVLPRFDPALGTLLSARLEIDGNLISGLEIDALGLTGLVVTGADASATTSLFVPLDSNLRGLPGLAASQTLNTLHPFILASATAFFAPSAYDFTYRESTRSFDQTYTGAALAAFQNPFGALSLEMTHHIVQVRHAGSLAGTLLQLPEPGVPAGSTKPGEITGVILAAQLVNLLTGSGPVHGALYADAHFATAAGWEARVTYTYETVAAVPEPGTLSLLGVALVTLVATIRVSPRC